jgi:hypothetical protein
MAGQLLKFTVKDGFSKVEEFEASVDMDDPGMTLYLLLAAALRRKGKKLIEDYSMEIKDQNGRVIHKNYVVLDPKIT